MKHIYNAANGIRKRVLDYTLRNNGGYLSQACSSAEIMAALYLRIMRLGPVAEPILPGVFCGVPGRQSGDYVPGHVFNGPRGPEYDRFFLSPTHYSLVLYAALVEAGRMHSDGLSAFNRDGGVVEMIGAEHSPGMEVMTGSLGQGISQAAGMAMARKIRRESGRVFVFMSDGELQPGQVWEAFQSMSFYRLDNMVVYVDINGYQCDGPTCHVMKIEPLEERCAAFGCEVKRVDGHDVEALIGAAERKPAGKPLVVLCDTCPWQGIDILQDRAPKFHYVRFRDEEEMERFRKYAV